MELGSPDAQYPDCGRMEFLVDFSPCGSPNFEVNHVELPLQVCQRRNRDSHYTKHFLLVYHGTCRPSIAYGAKLADTPFSLHFLCGREGKGKTWVEN